MQALQAILSQKRTSASLVGAADGDKAAAPPGSDGRAAGMAAASEAGVPAAAATGALDSPTFHKAELSEQEVQLITDVVSQVLARSGAAPAEPVEVGGRPGGGGGCSTRGTGR